MKTKIRSVMSLGRKALVGSVAAALLGVIAFDLVDTQCDPLRLTGGWVVVDTSSDADIDACADVCVPDCFCCSTTVLALAPYALTIAGTTPQAPAPPSYRITAGVRRVPDHVPLTLL